MWGLGGGCIEQTEALSILLECSRGVPGGGAGEVGQHGRGEGGGADETSCTIWMLDSP